MAVIVALLSAFRSTIRSHAELVAENLALQHQLAVLRLQATVAKYLAGRRGTPPSQTWRTFLSNHVAQLASADKDPPVPRATQTPRDGRIIAVPHVGGLHHHYERRAA